MSRFIIPQGTDYTFTVQIMEEDSFLPQNVSELDNLLSEFKIRNKADGTPAVDVNGIELAQMLVERKAVIVGNTAAVPEDTTLQISRVGYEKYSITVKGEVYEVDNETDIFSVNTQSGAVNAGDTVATVVIHSSSITAATVSNQDGYYTTNGNYIVLTQSGADAITAGTSLTDYDVTVGTRTLTISGGLSNTNDTLTSAGKIMDSLNTAMTVLPEYVGKTHPSGSDVITIIENAGGQAKVDKSTNIVQTAYTIGSPEITADWYDQNGYLVVSMYASETAKLNVLEGDGVDNYYLKSEYMGIINIKFSNVNGNPNPLNRVARIADIYVSYAGA